MDELTIGIGLAEVVCGTVIITLSLYLQLTVGKKAAGRHVPHGRYMFLAAFVLMGVLCFVRAAFMGCGWLEASVLLTALSAPVAGMLLFWPTFGRFCAVGRHGERHLGCRRRRLALAWMGINIFSLLPVLLNAIAFMPLATMVSSALVTVCCFVYAVDYGRRMEECMERKRPMADTPPRSGADAGAEAIKPVVQVVYDTVTMDERIKGKLQKWVESKGFCQTGVTINDLSKQIGINRTYLSKHINECYSCNFNCWINKLRVCEAEEMMRRNPDLPLSDVAEQVGYADISHFSRQFKYIKGEPPSLYGKKIRQTSDLSKRTQ